MMRRIALLTLGLFAMNAAAQDTRERRITSSYSHLLDSLIEARQRADKQMADRGRTVTLNPYFYRLMTPGTLYTGALSRTLGVNWSATQSLPVFGTSSLVKDYSWDYALAALHATDRSLASLYTRYPSLIVRTEADLLQELRLREAVKQPLEVEAKMAEKVVPADLGTGVTDPVEAQARKPQFWKFSGNGSLQFTQSYYSNNWYQGGDNNYAALAALTLEAKYDNKQKTQWDNKLEMQLGFQTSNDTHHSLKATNNLLRLTSKLGYKAAKNWYYTGQVVAYTQFVPNYNSNANTFSSSFLSPLNLTISIGMDYKFKSKKEKFTGSLLLSPVAYNMRYVREDSLRSRYKVEEGKVAYHNFGPNVTFNYCWIITKDIRWDARLYYFTNLDYVDIEWENTFTFTINKYLSSKLFLYPRYDDSAPSYRGKHGYLMFKEWLSLGINYNF